MKVKCDFCKTEYTPGSLTAGVVKCAVCGHEWSVTRPAHRSSWLMFFASLCALLSAIIFTVAVITHHQAKNADRGPLVATVTNVAPTTDENGVSRIVVTGQIENISGDIYGVPDLIIVSLDDKGNVLARQKFMPSATLLDSGSYTEFRHILSVPVSAVKKITVELPDLPTAGGKK
jgi:hypothetical protein